MSYIGRVSSHRLSPSQRKAVVQASASTRIDVSLFAAPAFSIALEAGGELRYDGLNDVICRLSGLKREQMIGRTPAECLPPDVAVQFETQYRHCIETRGAYEYEERLDLPGGAKWWRTTLSPLIDTVTKEVVGVFGLTMDVTDQKLAEIELRSAAYKDPLTGICNRRRFDRDIQNAVTQANEVGLPFAVVLADIDRFKPINDTHGHATGDAVLKEVAGRLARGIRKTDHLARIGGDEFAAIIFADSGEGVGVAVDRMRASVKGTVHANDHNIIVTVSMGAALWREGMTAAMILAAADAAMYREKADRAA